MLKAVKSWARWEARTPRFPSLVALARRYLAWSRSARFDVQLRYHAAGLVLRRHGRSIGLSPTILDVGSGPLGIATYLQRECVGVDVAFPKGSGQGPLVRVRASVANLPFRNRAFEFVTCMDALEHIPVPDRPAAIHELFRVASRGLFVGVPFGTKAASYDRRAQSIERERGVEPAWRSEHVTNGLPGPELDALVQSTADRFHARVSIGKHENIRWLRLRWRVALAVPQSHPAYGLLMAPLYTIAKQFHLGHCYRRTYFVQYA